MKNAVACFLVFAFSVFGLWGLPPQLTVRSNVSLVNIYFSALDKKGVPVTGLTKQDFEVFENGDRQEIEFFSETEKRRDVILTIALLIDTSGSVKDKLGYEVETAAEFFREILRPDLDLALIVQFDSQVNLVQDFTQNQDNLIRALHSLRAGGNTTLYDAIYLAAEDKLKDEAGRRVMVVISDGDDTSSLVSREEALEAAQKSDALIYGIGVRGKESRGDFGALKDFAKQTGGAFFSPNAEFEKIQEAFQSIKREIRGQYSLAYSPRDKRKNGAFRSIEIRCSRKDVRVRARRGYYAPDSSRTESETVP
jgi:VWFA-related protein